MYLKKRQIRKLKNSSINNQMILNKTKQHEVKQTKGKRQNSTNK